MDLYLWDIYIYIYLSIWLLYSHVGLSCKSPKVDLLFGSAQGSGGYGPPKAEVEVDPMVPWSGCPNFQKSITSVKTTFNRIAHSSDPFEREEPMQLQGAHRTSLGQLDSS